MASNPVTITDLRWYPYRVPFRRPIAIAHGTLEAREGAVVELVTDAGTVGVGEIAPPPGFGRTLEEALAPLPALAAAIRTRRRDHPLKAALEYPDLPPATRFALATALFDAAPPPVSQHPPTRSVPVNATVTARAPDEAAAAAHAAVAAGFQCVKLKVGVCDDPNAELARIAAVRVAIGPAVQLRLDANEAWDFDHALEILTRAARYAIEYVEQPLPAADLAGMRRLREAALIPIAADEAAGDAAAIQRILAAEAADVIVLKPQCLGGYAPVADHVRRRPSGVRYVVTSAMEAGIGVVASLHIAAVLTASTAASAPLACGLATLHLLEDDLILDPPRIENGEMLLPDGRGLGVTLDRAALGRYAHPTLHGSRSP
jgi:o-succinylbenzoate synthase